MLAQTSRTITNRVSQTLFDKLQAHAWQILEAEIPRFTPSVDRLCFEGTLG
jgi:hypothetical protein